MNERYIIIFGKQDIKLSIMYVMNIILGLVCCGGDDEEQR